MLFLVIAKPIPTPPSQARSNRKKIWDWAQPLMDRGVIKDRTMYAKVGRGSVVLYDVESIEELHRLLSQWLELIPAEFEIHPLMDQSATAAFLGEGQTG
jgi:hypothetical protein